MLKRITRPRKPMPLQGFVPSPRTKKLIYLPGIEDNTIEEYIIKDVRNLFRPKKENKAINEKIIIDIRTLFESGKINIIN